MKKLNCPACGASLKSGQNICDYCGSEFILEEKLKNTVSLQTETAPPPADTAKTEGGWGKNPQQNAGVYPYASQSGGSGNVSGGGQIPYGYPHQNNSGGQNNYYRQRQYREKAKDKYGVTSLILSIIGIFICPILLVISLTYSGKQLAIMPNASAKAAKFISVMGIIIWVLYLVSMSDKITSYIEYFF